MEKGNRKPESEDTSLYATLQEPEFRCTFHTELIRSFCMCQLP